MAVKIRKRKVDVMSISLEKFFPIVFKRDGEKTSLHIRVFFKGTRFVIIRDASSSKNCGKWLQCVCVILVTFHNRMERREPFSLFHLERNGKVKSLGNRCWKQKKKGRLPWGIANLWRGIWAVIPDFTVVMMMILDGGMQRVTAVKQ